MSWELETAKKVVEQFNKDSLPFEKRGHVLLLYGDTSTGKTFTALTYPEPVFIIDTESRAINTKYDCKDFVNKKIEIYEPVETAELMLKDSDVFDEHKTINNITEYIINLANRIKGGEIKQGTIVLDSATDVWSWIQEWMRVELAKLTNKDGSRKASTMLMSVNNQLDWKIANRRHYDIINVLRVLTKYGINVVITAREEQAPSYINKEDVSNKDKIRSHKDLPFLADVTFHLKRITTDKTRYMAICEKLRGKPIPNQQIEMLNYEKIKQMLELKE